MKILRRPLYSSRNPGGCELVLACAARLHAGDDCVGSRFGDIVRRNFGASLFAFAAHVLLVANEQHDERNRASGECRGRAKRGMVTEKRAFYSGKTVGGIGRSGGN